jgi:hypothetical protein
LFPTDSFVELDGSCVIALDEDGAVALRDLLIEWLG